MSKSEANPRHIPNVVWVLLTVVVALVAAQMYGRGAFFLVMGGGVLLGAIAILWNSIQALTGDAPLSLDEALSLAAPSTEEERKASVLRALKDLEYERSVGKLTEADYRELTRRYRQEAKQLLLLLDENMAPARERAEQLLQQRLRAQPKAKSATDSEASKAPRRDLDAELDDALDNTRDETAAASGSASLGGTDDGTEESVPNPVTGDSAASKTSGAK